ncbi:MAG: cupin domain-containing protein [Dongiaceae bacterium]
MYAQGGFRRLCPFAAIAGLWYPWSLDAQGSMKGMRMSESKPLGPVAVRPETVPPRTTPSNYPEPFFSRMAKREKRPLGDFFGLKNFGANLTKLAPGGESALLHRHSKQDEFVFVLQSDPTLVTDTEEIRLCPGMCAGFPAQGVAHQLVNRTDRDVVFLEIGDRTSGDEGSYPKDDLQAVLAADGKWKFTHKDGRPY